MMRLRKILQQGPTGSILIGIWLALTTQEVINALNIPVSALVLDVINALLRRTTWDVVPLNSYSVSWPDFLYFVSFPIVALIAGMVLALWVFPANHPEYDRSA